MNESWKQSSAMMKQEGLAGATSGNCRITPPTLLKSIGSLANHPRCKDEEQENEYREEVLNS